MTELITTVLSEDTQKRVEIWRTDEIRRDGSIRLILTFIDEDGLVRAHLGMTELVTHNIAEDIAEDYLTGAFDPQYETHRQILREKGYYGV